MRGSEAHALPSRRELLVGALGLALLACTSTRATGSDAIRPVDSGTEAGVSAGTEAGADARVHAAAPTPAPPDDCPLPRSNIPSVLASVSAAALAVDGAHLYIAATSAGPCPWGSRCAIAAGDLVRMPRCGGPPEIVVAGATATALFDAPGVIYFTPASGAGLVQVDKRTLRATPVTGTASGCIGSAAAGADHLYFHDSCAGNLSRFAHAGGAVEIVRAGVKSTNSSWPDVHVAVSPNAVYWSADGRTDGVALDGSALRTVPDVLQVFAADGTALYGERASGFGSSSIGSCSALERVPLDGSAASPAGICDTRGVVLAPPYVFQSTLVRSGGIPARFALTPSVYVATPANGDIGPLIDSYGAFAASPARIYFSEASLLLTAAMADASTPVSGGAAPVAAAFDWAATTEPGAASNEAADVLAAPAGGALAVGLEAPPVTFANGGVAYGDFEPALVRAADDGSILWRTRIDLSAQYITASVSLCAATAAEALVVARAMASPPGPGGATTLLLHRSMTDGSALRQTALPLSVSGCAAASAGDAFLAGLSTGGSDGYSPEDLVIERVDAAGNELWRRTFARALSPASPAVTVTSVPSGDVLVAGRLVAATDFGAGAIGNPGAGFLLRLSGAGNVVDARGFGDFVPGAIASDASGRVVLLGSAEGIFDVGRGAEVLPLRARPHTLVVALGPDGKLLFRTVFEGGEPSQGNGHRLALGPGGDVFALVHGVPSIEVAPSQVLTTENSILLRLGGDGAFVAARELSTSSAIGTDATGAVVATWWAPVDAMGSRDTGRLARVAW